MSLVSLDEVRPQDDSAVLSGRWYGVYPAIVIDIRDPDSQGRVKVSLPWAQDPAGSGYEVWARLATMWAGADRGAWFVPDIDDEVLVAFEAGDPSRPYVVGSLWNGEDHPPEVMDGSGRNYKKVLQSRNGVTIVLDDQDGQERLVLKTPGGQKLTLSDGPGCVELVDGNGNQIKLESSGITITASAKVTVNANTVALSAGMVTIDAGLLKCSGVIEADTVITNSIVSSSYTPGAGNIW